ncbi:MAG: GNAT family N-acetyltransferase [Bacteroidetes bacterium]|nr:MAG: GNAT family N-acetyltransferase [Bacteroidota bacterium]
MFDCLDLLAYRQARLAYVPCLFALPAYLEQTGEQVSIFAVRNAEGFLEGIMPFVLREGVAYNPPRATFGGWYGNDLPTEVFQDFFGFVVGKLREAGAEKICVKLPPDSSLPAFLPFPALPADLNYHLSLSSDFVGKLHHSEKRRLRKAQQARLVGKHWASPDLDVVHQFIAQARERKGFPMTLSLPAFRAMFEAFPAYYDVFVVRSQAQELVALTVTVRTDAHTLYNFYPADSEAWLAYSPMVLLLEFVANWAKERGFEVFDLGIATENGTRNEGLIRFKKNIGGIETLKYTLWG